MIQVARKLACFVIILFTQSIFATDFMVSASHPLATKTGVNILKSGGNAIDAAVAMQFVLTLVEPHSTGVGGGGFLVYYDNDNKKLLSYDGRESAPATYNSNIFIKDNKAIEFCDAATSGISVGVPGLVKLLEVVHKKHGKLAWGELFTDSINLAQNGFTVSTRLSNVIGMGCSDKLLQNTNTREYFFPENKKLPRQTVITNKKLAKVFKKIKIKGSDGFYKGDVAKNIVKTVKSFGGNLTLNDLGNYKVKEREPICFKYRGNSICGMAPPSSGPVTIGQILKILSRFDLTKNPLDVKAWHYYIEASKLSYADRELYLADPDFVDVPVSNLLDDNYLIKRSLSISPKYIIATPAKAGIFKDKLKPALYKNHEVNSTSHLAVVDRNGNAVSFTSTIEHVFGSSIMSNGFLLNNELTDFSFVPEIDGKLVANRVQANKRPRSSMSPIIVFDENNNLKMLVGSAGGSKIIHYVAKTLIGVLDWDLGIQHAINLPNIVNLNGDTIFEQGAGLDKLKDDLERLGHNIKYSKLTSGIQGILIKDGKVMGAADPRREGLALGE